MSDAIAEPGDDAVPILVVDDNASALYVTGRILRGAGYRVLEARSGGAALEKAQQARLLVLDVNLPDMDGYEVCRRLRGEGRRLPMYPANHAVRAVPLPAGRHVVRFEYRTPGLMAGALTSAAAVLLLAAAGVLQARRARRRRTHAVG